MSRVDTTRLLSRPWSLFSRAATLGAMAVWACSCASSPRPIAPPSPLQQAVWAMDRKEWEDAHRFLSAIVPAIPERETDHTEQP